MKDLLLDENFDITNDIGEATVQTTEIAVMSQKGMYKKYPTIGVNMVDFIKASNDVSGLENRVKLELEVDGAEVSEADFTNIPFKVTAQWQS